MFMNPVVFIIFLMLHIFSSSGFAQSFCSDIFTKRPIVADIRVEKVLPSLGLYEGKDPDGRPNKSLQIKKRWRLSPQAKILKDFKAAWNVELYYLVEPPSPLNGHYPNRIETLLSHSQVKGIFIPINTLANFEKLTLHLVALNSNMAKLHELAQDQIQFSLSSLSSEGFELRINEINPHTTSPAFRWMRARMLRHGMDFVFTNPTHNPQFHRNNEGQSWGLNIEILDSFLFSPPEVSLNLLGHEIAHSTSYARMVKQGDVSRMISFWAGINNNRGLVHNHNMPSAYQRYFRSDEYEAWSITDKFSFDQSPRSSFHFMDNQIHWLQQLREELPFHFHYLKYFETQKSILELPEELNSFIMDKHYPFVLNPKTPDEVIILIPRLEKPMDEIGREDFITQVIDRRIKYLKTRKRIDLIKLERQAERILSESKNQ